MRDANKPIGYLVKQVDKLLTKGIDNIQQAAGLNRTSWQILHSVSEMELVKKDNLALLMKPFANTTEVENLLNEFIEDKILQTEAGANYQLTEKGKQLHEQCLQQQTAFRQKVTAGIAPDDYTTTLHTLEKIIDNLSK